MSLLLGDPSEVSGRAQVGVQPLPPTHGDRLDGDSLLTARPNPVHQSIPWFDPTLRVEVDLKTVREVACGNSLIEPYSGDFA